MMQVPHMTLDAAARLAAVGGEGEEGVESVYALAAMDAGLRQRTLGFTSMQLADVAAFCNRYPNIDVTYELEVSSCRPMSLSFAPKSDLFLAGLHRAFRRRRVPFCGA